MSDSYESQLLKLSTDPENYRGENWDMSLNIGINADKQIANLQAKLKEVRAEKSELKELICSGWDFIEDEISMSFLTPGYKKWLDGLKAVVENRKG